MGCQGFRTGISSYHFAPHCIADRVDLGPALGALALVLRDNLDESAYCLIEIVAAHPWVAARPYDLIPSSRAAVPPRIASLSSSLKPGVPRIRSTCVLVQG